MSLQSFRQLVRDWLALLIIGLLIRIMTKKASDTITENFKFSEFDAPNDLKVRGNIRRLVENVLQPLRDSIKLPIIITSGFRDEETNTRVKGVKNSHHLTGQGADFIVRGASLSDVFNTIQALKLPFNELILYREGSRSATGHIHVSYISPEKNSGRVFITESNYKRK